MNQFPIMWQGDNIVMVVNNQPTVVNKNSHPNYMLIVDAIKNKDWQLAADLVVVEDKMKSYTNGDITIVDGVASYKGEQLPEALGKALSRMVDEELPYDHFVAFIENLYQNPSNRSIDSLYTFLEKWEMPITEDGCFMAYKSVDEEYMSRHADQTTGAKVRYMVGDVVTMPRNKISDDPAHACHQGLHACSFNYLQSWGGKHLMLVKINPQNVVCVPYDCGHQKMRVCEMEVVSEVLRDDGSPWGGTFSDEYDHLGFDDVVEEKLVYTAEEVERIRDQAFNEGRNEGFDEGHSDGYSQGYDVGYDSGQVDD